MTKRAYEIKPIRGFLCPPHGDCNDEEFPNTKELDFYMRKSSKKTNKYFPCPYENCDKLFNDRDGFIIFNISTHEGLETRNENRVSIVWKNCKPDGQMVS